MSDDKTPDSEPEVDEREENEAESRKKDQGSPDSVAPADDDIIIK